MTLLLPRLHRKVPTCYDEGAYQPIKEAIAAGLLKLTDKAESPTEHLRLALDRAGLDPFEDMGQVTFGTGSNKEMLIDVGIWPLNGGNGNRLQLAPVFAEIPGASPDLIRWLAAVLNKHPLICGPHVWSRLLEEYCGEFTDPDSDEQRPPPDVDHALFTLDWLKSSLDDIGPSRDSVHLAELAAHSAKLAAIFTQLVAVCRTSPIGNYMSDRVWCVCEWDGKLDPISHCWDYEVGLDREGGLGDSAEVFAFRVDNWGDLRSALSALNKAIEPVNLLTAWKSKKNLPATPSAVLS